MILGSTIIEILLQVLLVSMLIVYVPNAIVRVINYILIIVLFLMWFIGSTIKILLKPFTYKK